MSKPLDSTNVVTNNIVLKVTVPKRTGLKRKRGSEGPYYEPLDFEVGQASVQKREQVDTVKDAQYLVRTMRENPKKYQVQAIGTIDNTHRFRGIIPSIKQFL